MDRKHNLAPRWTWPEAGTALGCSVDVRQVGWGLGSAGLQGCVHPQASPWGIYTFTHTCHVPERRATSKKFGNNRVTAEVRQDFSERRDQSGRWRSPCSSPLSGSRKRVGAGTRTPRCSPQSRGVGGPQTHTCDLANTTIQQSGSRVCDAPSCSPAPLTATLRPLPPGRLASHPCRLILCPTVWALRFCAPVSRGPVGPAPSGGNCSRESSATAHQERTHLAPAPSSQSGEGVSGSFSRRATARR